MDEIGNWIKITHHISFIQSSFLTKIVWLDSISNLVFVVKISAQSKFYGDLACILVQGGLVLDYICNIKYGAFSGVVRPILDKRKFFMIFYGTSVFLRQSETIF